MREGFWKKGFFFFFGRIHKKTEKTISRWQFIILEIHICVCLNFEILKKRIFLFRRIHKKIENTISKRQFIILEICLNFEILKKRISLFRECVFKFWGIVILKKRISLFKRITRIHKKTEKDNLLFWKYIYICKFLDFQKKEFLFSGEYTRKLKTQF